MAKVTGGTHIPLNPVSSPDSTATKWNSAVYSHRPGSGKAASQSLTMSLGRMRDPKIMQAVKQAAPSALDTSIKSQRPGTITAIPEKIISKPTPNELVKKGYRFFLLHNKSIGIKENQKKENHELMTFTLDKQLSKLRAGEKLSNVELTNVITAMEKTIPFLTLQMTGKEKTEELGPSRDECIYILEKAKKQQATESVSKSSQEVSQPTSKKNVNPERSVGSTALPIQPKNEKLLSYFDKHIRESLKHSKSFDYESTVSTMRSTFINLEKKGKLNSDDLKEEFTAKITATSRNMINKQKLNAVEIEILNYKLLESFKKAQQDEAMAQNRPAKSDLS